MAIKISNLITTANQFLTFYSSAFLHVQCQSQLKTLYAEGITGCHMEFAAYNLLCVILHSNNNRDLVSAMSRFATMTGFILVCFGLLMPVSLCTYFMIFITIGDSILLWSYFMHDSSVFWC